MVVLGRARRGGAGRVRRARRRRAGRGRRHDLALGRSERAREHVRLDASGRASSSPTSSSRPSGRSGMPRSCAAPRSSTCRRRGRDPARALRRADRRADRARRGHGGLLPERGPAAGRGDRRDRARARRARRSSTPTRRSAAIPIDVAELGVDFLGAGVLKYLLASAGLGFLWCRPGLAESLLPTQTGWLADRNIFEMDIHDYSPSPTARRFESGTPPIPAIYAGIAGHRADARDRDRGDARARDRRSTSG